MSIGGEDCLRNLYKSNPSITSLCNELNIKSNLGYKPKIYREKDRKIATGTAGVKNIYLTRRLLDELEVRRDVVKAVLAHEIIHLKYKDTASNLKRIYSLYSKEFMGIKLLHEVRANIEGYSLTGFTDDKINEIEMYLKGVNKNKDDKKSNYDTGYPSRKQVVAYARKYDEMSIELAEKILLDFCHIQKIKNEKAFITKCIKKAKIT